MLSSMPWKSHDPEFLSRPPRKTPLLGGPARRTILTSLVTYLALARLLAFFTPVVAAPPTPMQMVLVPVPAMPPVLLKVPAGEPLDFTRNRQPPDDRFMRVVPAGLDEKAVSIARAGIDERIILDPYREADLRIAENQPVPDADASAVGHLYIPGPPPAVIPVLPQIVPRRPSPR